MGSVPTETIEELREDRTHGGSWAARIAVEAVAAVAETDADSAEQLLERMAEASRELAASRPGLVAVAGALGRLLAAADGHTHLGADQFRRLIREEAQALLQSRDRAAAAIAVQLRPQLEDAVVLTHSASGTVKEALVHGSPRTVLCMATAPDDEGRRLADELAALGLDAEVGEDEDGPHHVAESNVLLVGADTVFRCGTLENKRGTRRLAEAASAKGIPVLVACEVIKLAPITAAEAGVAETAGGRFDLTPPGLVSLVVTEEGAYPADEIRTLVDRTPFLRAGWRLLEQR